MSCGNANPDHLKRMEEKRLLDEKMDSGPLDVDEFDARRVFGLLRDINDPEHPLTLEELNVVSEENIKVDSEKKEMAVDFTPTIPHCSMATLIGLTIRVQLLRNIPADYKVDVRITPGSHSTEDAINKQLADKERVAAALENNHLLEVVNQCLTVRDRD